MPSTTHYARCRLCRRYPAEAGKISKRGLCGECAEAKHRAMVALYRDALKPINRQAEAVVRRSHVA